MAAVIGLELLARRARLPPAAAFILGGTALALIPGVPDIELDPDLALILFLPPLLLSSAFFTVWRDFRANLRIIVQLAVGAVAFTTLAVGLVAHLVGPSLPWAACFALGAIVSPPDAVAAKAVLQGLPLPRRIIVLLEGESLVNDASGLVLYRFAVAAALTGTFDAKIASLTFIVLSVGGVAVGAAFGWLVTILLRRLRDPTLAILASFLAAWAAYIGGEAMHVSGVLSTVACGLVMGWRQHKVLTAATRLEAFAVWKVAVFVLESLIFILIGLSLRAVVERLGGSWHWATDAIGVGNCGNCDPDPLHVDVSCHLRATFPCIGAASSRPLSPGFGADHHELGRNARRCEPCCSPGPSGRISGARLHCCDDLCDHHGDRSASGRNVGSADQSPRFRRIREDGS
jgi:monovalent cation/hydrogen antiporter